MTILKQNWSQIYSKLLKIAYGGIAHQTPQRGFAPVTHWGLQASPQTPCLGRIA